MILKPRLLGFEYCQLEWSVLGTIIIIELENLLGSKSDAFSKDLKTKQNKTSTTLETKTVSWTVLCLPRPQVPVLETMANQHSSSLLSQGKSGLTLGKDQCRARMGEQ